MAKKRLADLLRQEAQKFPESEGETVASAIALDPPQPDAETVEESDALGANSPNAELEATVTELKALLEQSEQKESASQQQIADLKSKLDEQKKLVNKLQKELDEANSTKAELEKAKKAAAQLAETNSKLQKQLDEANSIKGELEKAKKAAEQLANANSNLERELTELKKPKETIKTQIYKTPERKYPYFQSQPVEQSGDFAANTWLLD